MKRWMACLLVLCSCSGEGGADAGGVADAGSDAAAAIDGGMDAGGRDAGAGRDAGPELDAGPEADAGPGPDGGTDAGPGVFLIPGFACAPDFVIAAIYDDGAPPGEYTLRALGPMGPGVTLRRDGAPVSTVTYDWRATIGPLGVGPEHTFSFHGYFHVVVAHASAGTRDLSGLDACLFDGTKVLRNAIPRPDAGPMYDAGPFHDAGHDGGTLQDGGCVLDDIYEEDDVVGDARPLPFGSTIGYTACADGARAPDLDWYAPMTHTDSRFLELDGLGGDYDVQYYDGAGRLVGTERGTPPLRIVLPTGVRTLAVGRVALFPCSCADYSIRMETTIFW